MISEILHQWEYKKQNGWDVWPFQICPWVVNLLEGAGAGSSSALNYHSRCWNAPDLIPPLASLPPLMGWEHTGKMMAIEWASSRGSLIVCGLSLETNWGFRSGGSNGGSYCDVKSLAKARVIRRCDRAESVTATGRKHVDTLIDARYIERRWWLFSWLGFHWTPPFHRQIKAQHREGKKIRTNLPSCFLIVCQVTKDIMSLLEQSSCHNHNARAAPCLFPFKKKKKKCVASCSDKELRFAKDMPLTKGQLSIDCQHFKICMNIRVELQPLGFYLFFYFISVSLDSCSDDDHSAHNNASSQNHLQWRSKRSHFLSTHAHSSSVHPAHVFCWNMR